MAMLFVLFGMGLVSFLCIFGIAAYFLPTIIAYQRHHENKKIILLLNFFLGWTFFGWIACLVWSFIDSSEN